MTEYSNGSYDLTGVAAGTITATLAPGATDVSFSRVGVLSTFDISSQAGATVTVDNTVEAGSALDLDTNGGAIILDNSTLYLSMCWAPWA